MPNRGFVEARYLWVKGLMTIEESHFRSPKCYKGFNKKPCTNELRVSRPDRNRILRPPKRRICAPVATKPCAKGLRILEKLHFQIFKMSKSNPMKARYLWFEALMTLEESHFYLTKTSNSAWHEASCPGVEDFTTRQESHFQSAKML
jgi:hypothetical protein